MTQIRMHTEQSRDATTMAWIVRDGLVSGAIEIGADDQDHIGELPVALSSFLTDGRLIRFVIEDGRIIATRGSGHSWNDVAPALNAAVIAVLRSDAGLHLPRTEGFEDQRLSDEVRAVLDGQVSDLVSSHGGKIELVDVKDGVVSLRLEGACKGCPSADLTLKAGIEAQLRQRFPAVTAVSAVSDVNVGTESLGSDRVQLPLINRTAPGPCPAEERNVANQPD
jgi:Fe-S cluster biogenesis protein NfuA